MPSTKLCALAEVLIGPENIGAMKESKEAYDPFLGLETLQWTIHRASVHGSMPLLWIIQFVGSSMIPKKFWADI